MIPRVEVPYNATAKTLAYRILALENPQNIEQLKEACKLRGHEVVPATTIQSAMEFLDKKDHVDVIVAAAHLENESVFDFIRTAKAPGSMHKDVPIVLLCSEPTAIGMVLSPVVESASLLAGADRYLLMPTFDADELMTLVESLFNAVPIKESQPE